MRRVPVVLFLVVGLLVPGPAGDAGEAPGIVLILDASGSMNRDAGNGATLLDEAKAALREIVLRLPETADVGLRVYGHRASTDDKAAGCVDTESIIPVGPVDRGAMLTAIGEFGARGWTPIGLSLQEAVGDLGPGGGTIVLVSDGVDTCAPPDPCEVAQQLAADGYVSHIHTIGLFLQDQAAVDQLQCIADAGNGTFTDVGSVDGILDSIAGVLDRVIQGGIESPSVQGALDRNLAPVLPWVSGPDIYGSLAQADATIGTGEMRWYAVDVSDELSQLAAYFNLDWQPALEADEFIGVRIFDDNGIEVGVPHAVAGVLVEAPQTLPLVEAADWLGDVPGAFPTALAVTDPVSMFPAWEPVEEWFQPTVERFADAGLNGGVYEAFKRGRFAEPLPAGTYYVGVRWEAEREALSWMHLSVTMYDVDLTQDDWRDDRIEPQVRIDDGTRIPFPLDPVRWSGGEVAEGLGTPLRAIEVWSAFDGDPEDYALELEEGEVVAVLRDVVFPRMDAGMERTHTTAVIVGASGEVAPMEFEGGDDLQLGFGEEPTWFTAPADGVYRIVVELAGADVAAEPATRTAIVVFSPDVPLGAGADDLAESPDDVMRRQALEALVAGLREVAAFVGG